MDYDFEKGTGCSGASAMGGILILAIGAFAFIKTSSDLESRNSPLLDNYLHNNATITKVVDNSSITQLSYVTCASTKLIKGKDSDGLACAFVGRPSLAHAGSPVVYVGSAGARDVVLSQSEVSEIAAKSWLKICLESNGLSLDSIEPPYSYLIKGGKGVIELTRTEDLLEKAFEHYGERYLPASLKARGVKADKQQVDAIKSFGLKG